MNQVDVVICSLPSLHLDHPPGAPALLQAALESSGIGAQSMDLSIDFFINQCSRDVNKSHVLSAIFRPTNEYIPQESRDAAESWITESIAKLKNINPKIIGLSVFTNFQHNATVMLTRAIRTHLPDAVIVLGGWGLTVNCNSLAGQKNIKRFDLLKPFHQYMQEQKLADETILSNDNPLARFVAFATQQLNQRVHEHEFAVTEAKTIYSSPIPNYDDYNLNNYVWNGDKSLPVTGSLGCVRNCTFCDIPGQFGRFKYRTGADIAQELIALKEKYQINTFEFTDSLVNGSIKAFKEWLEIVADYNDNNQDKIQWFGQYICRPQAQVPENLYSLMKRSGVTNLVIGVESGNNEVLAAMKKKMTVQDVYDELAQFEKHGIKTTLLMLSGFYNETYERFLDSLQFIVNCSHYVANGTITNFGVGSPLFINEHMYVGEEADKLGIIVDPYDGFNWKLVNDDENDYVERARRRLITQVVINQLGIPTPAQNISNVYQMLQKLKNQLLELHE